MRQQQRGSGRQRQHHRHRQWRRSVLPSSSSVQQWFNGCIFFIVLIGWLTHHRNDVPSVFSCFFRGVTAAATTTTTSTTTSHSNSIWQPAGLTPDESGQGDVLHYTDGDGLEQTYRIPDTLMSFPERDKIREAMNFLLEETLDDIERLLNDVAQLAAKGVDLESETFAMEDDDDLVEYLPDESNSASSLDDTDEDDDIVAEEARLGATTTSSTGGPQPTTTTSKHLQRGYHPRGLSAVMPPKKAKYTGSKEHRHNERKHLIQLFHEVQGPTFLKNDWRWLDESIDHCLWGGITCGLPSEINAGVTWSDPSKQSNNVSSSYYDAVLQIDLRQTGLNGTLPLSVTQLEHLVVLNLADNQLQGTIPTNYANLTNLRGLDLSSNHLTGSIPTFLGSLPDLEELRLSDNDLTGTIIPNSTTVLASSNRLFLLDLSRNRINGTIPDAITHLTDLEVLLVGDTLVSGTLPTNLYQLTALEVLDVGSCALTASFDSLLSQLPSSLRLLNLCDNLFHGSISIEWTQLSDLELFLVSHNFITGTLPSSNDFEEDSDSSDSDDEDSDDEGRRTSYGNLSSLRFLWLSHNEMNGTLPPELFLGLQDTLETLDISYNQFTGTIPTEIGLLLELYSIDAIHNRLNGTLPNEMLQLNRNLRLNFTANLLTGTIPAMFCGEGAASMSMLYQEFGCDAVLCRPGTFSWYGHATLHSGCRPCPDHDNVNATASNQTNFSDITISVDHPNVPNMSNVLGRTSCDGVDFIHGDLNGDGILSSREILRILYIDTLGRFWGTDFYRWADVKVPECDLTGVSCRNGEIVKIDLTGASLCSDGDRKPAPNIFCKGIPSELGLLSSLEYLQFTRQKFLRSTIPTELGQLARIRLLDFTGCSFMDGKVPSELGLLSNLRVLKVSNTQISGSIPSELFQLPVLEVLHLTNNRLSGTLPPIHLSSIKEFMVARNDLSGSIPSELSQLADLENLEAYHNNFTGWLPQDIGQCTSLKRVDLFHNSLHGPLPDSLVELPNLQILHLKLNFFTGTIPELGMVPSLSWIDLSDNFLIGPVPVSLGSSRTLEDLRLGGNLLYEPIPHGLCSHPKLNGGATKAHGCEGVLCPLGTYAEAGHATASSRCTPCPAGQTTYYLGSKKSSCHILTEDRILAILFEVMRGPTWPEQMQVNWADFSKPLCHWIGMECNFETGELLGITFPMAGLAEDQLFQ